MPTIVISDNTGADFAGTEDAYLAEPSPSTNNSTGSVAVYSWAPGDKSTGVIRFTLPGALAGATINSATLELYRTAGETVTRTLDVHRLSRAWTEGGVTWNKYDGTNDWATGGGVGSGDIAASASSSVAVYAGSSDYKSFSGLGADVQAWVDGTTNNGWLVKRNDFTAGDSTTITFAGSEGTDGQRPKLTIDYTAGSGGSFKAAWLPRNQSSIGSR